MGAKRFTGEKLCILIKKNCQRRSRKTGTEGEDPGGRKSRRKRRRLGKKEVVF